MLPAPSAWLVPFAGPFRLVDHPTAPPEDAPGRKECKRRLAAAVDELDDLQRRLWAEDRRALLLVFQGMDAAGKDGTIRAVLSGVDPAGCHVTSFQAPSAEELDHDFLWRTTRRLPERGRIGVFNRSWYEEVLVVRVHPELLARQRLPDCADPEQRFAERLESIADHEKHLARSGTVVVKLWLHVSQAEQKRRLLDRLDEPASRWKFDPRDLDERARWADHQRAAEAALRATSRPWAPWYAVPADDKRWLRMTVAELVAATLRAMDPRFPQPAPEVLEGLAEYRRRLAGRKGSRKGSGIDI